MDSEQVTKLYDEEYARSYNAKFLTSEIAKASTEFEIALIGELLRPGLRWLDVACGTGFFLSQFPTFEREGLDISPSMLALARQANPGVSFHQRNYLESNANWENRWDLVSCMWYAYGLVGSMAEIERLFANLAAWTAPTGTCFVPLADPCLISGAKITYEIQSPWPGEVKITGLTWSYVEDNGAKVHAHQIAPHVDFMKELFEKFFESVELRPYPAGSDHSYVLIATNKRK